MKDNKTTKIVVVAFLLVIVVVSSLVLLGIYKAESAKTGTVKTTIR